MNHLRENKHPLWMYIRYDNDGLLKNRLKFTYDAIIMLENFEYNSNITHESYVLFDNSPIIK